jgi:hypothetical protein
VPAGLPLALVLLFGLLSFFLFLLTVSSHPSVSLCFVLTYHLVGKFVELTGLLLIYSRSWLRVGFRIGKRCFSAVCGVGVSTLL